MAKVNLKIALLGDGAVGKTSLRRRFMGKRFLQQHHLTIGADFSTITREIDGDDVTYQIWDLAGQDTFTAVRGRFYKGVLGALVVFDITRPKSFKAIPKWIEELWQHNGKGKIPLTILGNKSDLRDKDSISSEKGKDYASKLTKALNDFEVHYLDTSAKTGLNVEEAFEILGKQIITVLHKRYK